MGLSRNWKKKRNEHWNGNRKKLESIQKGNRKETGTGTRKEIKMYWKLS